MTKFVEFEKFHERRLSRPAWDWPGTPGGFPAEIPHISSDISNHMPMLTFLARRCHTVTEVGTRYCSSTSAFIAGRPHKVVAFDLFNNGDIQLLINLNARKLLPCQFEFHQANILEVPQIERTDLLFLDSLHVYEQVRQELALHAEAVSKWLVFHDSHSQGEKSVDRPGEKGIRPAIDEFLAENGDWELTYESKVNHGLVVLEKTFGV